MPHRTPLWGDSLLELSPELDLLQNYTGQGYEPRTTLPVPRGHWNSPVVANGITAFGEGNANEHRTSGTLNIYHLP